MAAFCGKAEQVVFSHATNSRAKLREALSSPSVNFIEADVMVTAACVGNHAPPMSEVIMSHPPFRTSDLTLESFLDIVASKTGERRRGIKLDFKDPEAVGVALEVLRAVRARHGEDCFGEIWLNADVLQGPGGDPSPFDPEHFCEASARGLPEAVLSLGWKVSSASLEGYTEAQATEMLALCRRHGLEGPQVTFALSAFHASQRPETVRQLLVPGHTVSLWGPSNARCDAWIAELRNDFPGKIYVDTKAPGFLQGMVWNVAQATGFMR